jgi:hypothetical protein
MGLLAVFCLMNGPHEASKTPQISQKLFHNMDWYKSKGKGWTHLLLVASLQIFPLQIFALLITLQQQALNVNANSSTGVSSIFWLCLALCVFEIQSCRKTPNQEVWILLSSRSCTWQCDDDLGLASLISIFSLWPFHKIKQKCSGNFPSLQHNTKESCFDHPFEH